MNGAKSSAAGPSVAVFNFPAGLPANVREVLSSFLSRAQQAFGADLSAAVLFGSAVDGGLRKSSDVNLILVLRRFPPEAARLLRSELETAQAAILLRVMFLAQEEIPAACEAFAQKFSDIVRRRAVLFGPDPFAGLNIPRAAQVWRLRQVLLNLVLRLREVYVEQENGSAIVLSMLAESVGALRSSAVLLLQLEGRDVPKNDAPKHDAPKHDAPKHDAPKHDAPKPKQALAEVAEQLAAGKFATSLAMLSQLRETGSLADADAQQAMIAVMELAAAMHARAAALES